MGGNISSTNKTLQIPIRSSKSKGSGGGKTTIITEDTAKCLVMPIYYTKVELTIEEKEAALTVWKLISSNKAPNYLALKQSSIATNDTFKYALCSEFFYDIFFDRLSDVHPASRPLFSKSGQRMRQYFLASITMLLSLIEIPEKFNKTLIHLAHVHNKIGVKAIEYGIVGEVLMYTIQKCCGDAYNTQAHQGWAKVLSRILDVIVPVVIHFEITKEEEDDGDKDELSRRSAAASIGWHDQNTTASNKSNIIQESEIRSPERHRTNTNQ